MPEQKTQMQENPAQDGPKPEKKKTDFKSSWLFWVALIAALLLIGGSVYYYFFYKEKQDTGDGADQTTPVEEGEGDETSSETYTYSGWKTYDSSEEDPQFYETDETSEGLPTTEETFDFTFKYPSTWTISGSTFDDENGNKIAELSPGGVFLGEYSCFDWMEDEMVGEGGSISLVSKQNITINNKAIVRRIDLVNNDQDETYYSHHYCLESNDKAVILAFIDESKDPNQPFQKVAGSIEIEDSTDTYAGWETYTNESLGFTFQYPDDWTLEEDIDPSPEEAQDFISVSNGDYEFTISAVRLATGDQEMEITTEYETFTNILGDPVIRWVYDSPQEGVTEYSYTDNYRTEEGKVYAGGLSSYGEYPTMVYFDTPETADQNELDSMLAIADNIVKSLISIE